MDIKDIKELKALLQLCRKQGVLEIKLGEVEFKLGDLPVEKQEAELEVDAEDPYANFPQGVLTPEQLMFYSSGGAPENDPAMAGGQ